MDRPKERSHKGIRKSKLQLGGSMKIAVTGRPDVGKSTILRIVECEYPKKVVAGVDALNTVNRVVFPEAKTDASRCLYQKALYYLQQALEKIIEDTDPTKLILCDHGSLDLLALWPSSSDSFFKSLQSSLEAELARYDWVLQINGIEKKYSTATFQSYHEPRNFWQHHPRFLEIPMQKGFSFSYIQTAAVVKNILSGRSYTEVRKQLELANNSQRTGFLESAEAGYNGKENT